MCRAPSRFSSLRAVKISADVHGSGRNYWYAATGSRVAIPFFFMRTNGKVCRGKAGRIGAGCQCWERVERAGDAEKGQCEEPGPHAAALRLSSSSGVDFERSCLVLFASRASQSLRVLCPFCGEACPTGADLFSTLGQAFLFVL